ncbi:MAG: DegV family EDD domain-containing protein, partial [Ardenticatenales bacterium]|nr:DegV family EDD domain-containing protein [Ardenticatenales bacterium]
MVRIVTDSAANLSTDLVEKHNIHVVPLRVQMGSDTYREGIDLTQEEFFRRLPTTNPLPSTSQPTPLDFEEVYKEILATGDEIVSVHLSSDLSGTYNSARNAMLSFEGSPISIVDSRSVSAGIALHALAAARMAEAGK